MEEKLKSKASRRYIAVLDKVISLTANSRFQLSPLPTTILTNESILLRKRFE